MAGCQFSRFLGFQIPRPSIALADFTRGTDGARQSITHEVSGSVLRLRTVAPFPDRQPLALHWAGPLLQRAAMRADKVGFLPRAEQWLVDLAMATLALVLERLVLRSIRRGTGTGASGRLRR